MNLHIIIWQAAMFSCEDITLTEQCGAYAYPTIHLRIHKPALSDVDTIIRWLTDSKWNDIFSMCLSNLNNELAHTIFWQTTTKSKNNNVRQTFPSYIVTNDHSISHREGLPPISSYLNIFVDRSLAHFGFHFWALLLPGLVGVADGLADGWAVGLLVVG